MEKNTADTRRLMGCGFEMPHPSALPWCPPSGSAGYSHKRPKVCVGYLTSRPEVIEVARAHRSWSKGQLEHFIGGELATAELMQGIEIFDSAIDALNHWVLTPKKDGGGGG